MIHTVPAGLPPLDPPPLTVETMLFSWTFDSVVLVPLALTGVLYLWGVRRLRRRGDAWAPRRTAFFLLGLGLTVVGTASFLGVYDRVLFSVPAIQHMVLQMIAPVGLVLGAPISLALRALPMRRMGRPMPCSPRRRPASSSSMRRLFSRSRSWFGRARGRSALPASP